MLVLKYLLMIVGVGVFGSAAALVIYDIYLSAQLLRLLRREKVGGSSGADGGGRIEVGPWRASRRRSTLRARCGGGWRGNWCCSRSCHFCWR